ncbi:MAG: HNH endonuclease [Cyclobacteriaceae bacterium]|nr:HNH endonuclease [Cyclobacteriaceae bacterium]
MRFYIGVTDNNWYNFLSKTTPDDINFWQPGGNSNFKILSPGAPFLFKLKKPLNAIGGLGFFSSQTFLPLSVAWDIFAERNGCENLSGFKKLILSHRKDKQEINPTIGCIVLTNPIFFDQEDWIETPPNWAKSIVQGKSYSTGEPIGGNIWRRIELLLSKYLNQNVNPGLKSQLILEETDYPSAYGKSILAKVRLGQSAFRVLVTDAYERRCAITGEKTLPVLEAAHIKQYSESGPHFISNGILLRSDVHKLFDIGYLTITNDLKVEVSKRIKEEFENGREYYQYHGKNLNVLPNKDNNRPNSLYIDWHNSNIFKG